LRAKAITSRRVLGMAEVRRKGRRRAASAHQWRKAVPAVRPTGKRRVAWLGTTDVTDTLQGAQRMVHWVWASLGVRVRRGTAAGRAAVHDVARARGPDAFQRYTIQLSPL
jgi:hypothetical protein